MHCNARLTTFSRELLVKRYLERKKVTEISKQLSVSRKCCYFWIRRYQAEGRAGLDDRRSVPKTSPRRTSPKQEVKVLKMRKKYKEGPDRLASDLRCLVPPSTKCSKDMVNTASLNSKRKKRQSTMRKKSRAACKWT